MFNKVSSWRHNLFLMVIPKALLTWSLTLRLTVISAKKKSVWALFVCYIIGNQYNVMTVFKTKHVLRVHSWKPAQKEVCNRWHSASRAFPANEGEATLPKQAGRPLAMRLGERKGVPEKSKLAQHTQKEGHEVIWDEARILEF
jgi:hypothetical protein